MPLPVAFFSALATLFLLTRVGFLSALVMFFARSVVGFPLTLTPSDWYFSSSLVVLGSLAALGAWSYRAAVAGGSRSAPETR